jgi:hypothetical protein
VFFKRFRRRKDIKAVASSVQVVVPDYSRTIVRQRVPGRFRGRPGF